MYRVDTSLRLPKLQTVNGRSVQPIETQYLGSGTRFPLFPKVGWAPRLLAHERVQFTNVHPQQEEDGVVASSEADKKPRPDKMNYRVWATNIVRDELHKAGWRLADLLEKIP